MLDLDREAAIESAIEEDALLESDIELEALQESPQSSQEPVAAVPAAKGIRRYLTTGCQLYLIALFCGAGMKATSKLVLEEVKMPVLVFTRMGITLIIAVLCMWWKNVEHYFWGPPGVRMLILFRGILGCVNLILTMFALMYLRLPEQIVLSFLSPQVTAILARLVLHEAYFWQQAAWGIMSLGGVVLISKPPPLFNYTKSTPPVLVHRRMQAVVATLLVVVFASTVMVTVRKIGTRAHPMCITGSYSFFAVLFSGGWMIVDPTQAVLPQSLRTWALMIGAGTFGFMLQVLSSMALQREEASHLAAFRYTQVLWAVLLELAIWHDLPDIWTISGSILVAVGVIQTTLVRHRLQSANSEK